ncbi:hypothetical protein Q3G72_007966 [Acer saccharum]|nr:hypothetical protein Q3G72_007966 [Acer saccharum]
MTDSQPKIAKEESLYGPWLLVSYGKQGNRNYTGGRNGAGGNTRNGANNGTRNGGYTKYGAGGHTKIGNDNLRSGYDRKTGGESSEIKHGNNTENRVAKNNSKNGRVVKKSVGSMNSTGNRFEVLNEEVEDGGNPQTNPKPMSNKFKGKTVLTEITNAFGSKNSQPGKGITKVTKSIEKLSVKRGSLKDSGSYFKGDADHTDSFTQLRPNQSWQKCSVDLRNYDPYPNSTIRLTLTHAAIPSGHATLVHCDLPLQRGFIEFSRSNLRIFADSH